MKLSSSNRAGLGFGLTSGGITTLGVIVGLQAGTQSELAVIGGILTIAVADSFSDALGIHVSQESLDTYSGREVWSATISTFMSKFLVASSFVIPMLLFSGWTAVVISGLWGFFLLSWFSYMMAKDDDGGAVKVVLEHVLIGGAVVVVTYLVGNAVREMFG